MDTSTPDKQGGSYEMVGSDQYKNNDSFEASKKGDSKKYIVQHLDIKRDDIIPASKTGSGMDGVPIPSSINSPSKLTKKVVMDHGTNAEGGEKKPPNEWEPESYLFTLAICCLCVAVIRSFAPAPIGAMDTNCDKSLDSNGEIQDDDSGSGYCVCPRKTICATSTLEMIMLGCARGSAYFDYPFYVLIFLTKANNLRNYLQSTYLSEFLPFTESHDLHRLGGTIIGIEVCWHTFWHSLRWGLSGNFVRFLGTQTGITGFISFVLTFVIVWPMRLSWIKQRMSYEWRKGLHYLSWIWGISISLHAPATHIQIIMGLAVGIYIADYLYGFFFRTHFVESSSFTRLEGAVEFSFKAPPGFEDFRAAYIYLCIPWISKYEWHAFSIYRSSTDPDCVCACIAKGGEWTNALHKYVSKPTVQPCWVYGPFDSPFGRAVHHDNCFVVASGIGITPAVSVIHSYKATRKINLIWSVRDASLAEWFLDNTDFDDDAWSLIFYTGKRELVLKRKLRPTVLLLKGRPNFETVIVSIINGMETGVGEVPVELQDYSLHPARDNSESANFSNEMERIMCTYPGDDGIKELFHICLSKEKQIRDEDHIFDQEATISFPALRDGLCTLCVNLPNEEVVEREMKKLFDDLDTNKDGHVDLQEFENYLAVLHDKLLDTSSGQYQSNGKLDRFMEGGAGEESASRRSIALSGQGVVGALLGSPKNVKLSPKKAGSTAQIPFFEQDEESGSAPRKSFKDHLVNSANDEIGQSLTIEEPNKWCISYCGGSQVIVDKLEAISNKHHIRLDLEKFDW